MGRFELVTSEGIVDELISVFGKPYFRDRMSDQQAAENVALLRRRATVVEITVQMSGIATHPADDGIMSLAASAQADYLVTGDRRFRERVGTYQGVTLITPRDFLTLLDSDTDREPEHAVD